MKTIGNIIHNKTCPIRILDSKGHLIYLEYPDGYWTISEYDSNHIRIYYENSNGTLQDNRP